MYFARPSLSELSDLVGGYQIYPNSPFSFKMGEIVREYYNIKDVDVFFNRNWKDIIIFCEGSDERAFYKFYELLELYEKKYGSTEDSETHKEE